MIPHPVTVEYLLTNESFIDYCLRKDEGSILYWEKQQQDHPEYRQVFEQARQLVAAMYSYGQSAEIDEAQKELEALIGKKQGRARVLRRILSAAAVLLLIAGAAYFLKQRPVPVKYITVTTSAGEMKKISLPDGSQVWLNAGGSLQYPEGFQQRAIRLEEGEACFTVTHDAQRPFTVTTPSGINIEDKGTVFSVKSYAGLNEETIGVVEGMVEVKHPRSTKKTLKAGEGLVSDKITGAFKEQAFPEAAAGWINGDIVLNDISFRELQLTLQKIYNVNIVFNQPMLAQCRITTSFKRQEHIRQILDALKMVYGITYTVNGNTIRLSGNACN